MDNNMFNKCEHCEKRDVCLGECSWNSQIVESSYANYYAEEHGFYNQSDIAGIIMERGIFGDI